MADAKLTIKDLPTAVTVAEDADLLALWDDSDNTTSQFSIADLKTSVIDPQVSDEAALRTAADSGLQDQIDLKAPLDSPSLTGIPLVPTATNGTNTDQAASTAFVQDAVSSVTGAVVSVNARSGAVTLDASDVGLSAYAPYDPTTLPVSGPVLTALNNKEPTISAGVSSQYWRGDKTWQTLDKAAVGLGNVDNVTTADRVSAVNSQSWTDAQKYIARTNINAAPLPAGVAHMSDWGISNTNTPTNNSALMETLQAYLLATFGGGVIHVGYAPWSNPIVFGPNQSGLTFNNDGLTGVAISCGILLRPGISLQGISASESVISTNATGVSAVFNLSTDRAYIRDVGFNGPATGGTGGSCHAIFNVCPTAESQGKTNIAAPGTFAGGNESWAVGGDGTSSIVSGGSVNQFRVTANGSVSTQPWAYRAFTTVIGQNYMIRMSNNRGTISGQQFVGVSNTNVVGSVYTSEVFLQDVSSYFNFVATATTTYVLVYGSTVTASQYFQFGDVSMCAWDIADQKQYCNYWEVSNCRIANWSAYGIGINNGACVMPTMYRNHISLTGADGMDIKVRGDSATEFLNAGFIVGNYVKDHGQKLSLTAQAGIDLRGQHYCAGNHVEISNDTGSGQNRTGIRIRQADYSTGQGGARSRVIGNYVNVVTQDNAYCFGLNSTNCIATGNCAVNGQRGYSIDGLIISGGSNYIATGVKLSTNEAINCSFGYRSGTQAQNPFYDNCHSINCITAFYAGADSDTYRNCCTDTATVMLSTVGNNTSFRGGRIFGTVTTIRNGAGTGYVIGDVDGIKTRNQVDSAAYPVDAPGDFVINITHGVYTTPASTQCMISNTTSSGGQRVNVNKTGSYTSSNIGTYAHVVTNGAVGTTGKTTLWVNMENLL